jgi:hypothetical protein
MWIETSKKNVKQCITANQRLTVKNAAKLFRKHAVRRLPANIVYAAKQLWKNKPNNNCAKFSKNTKVTEHFKQRDYLD